MLRSCLFPAAALLAFGLTACLPTTPDDEPRLRLVPDPALQQELPPAPGDDDDDVEEPTPAPIEEPPACADDLLEPSNDVATAAAALDGQMRDLRLCPADEDWFELSVPASSHSDFSTFYDAEDGRIEATLYDAEGEELSYSAEDFGREINTLTSAEGGTFWVRLALVEDLGDQPGVDYTFESLIEVVGVCVDDPLEPNDDPPSAMSVDELDGGWLRVCRGLDDYWAVSLSEGEELSATINWDQDEGALWLVLIGADHRELDSNSAAGGVAEVSWVADTDLVVYIDVEMVEDAGEVPGADYLLSWSVD